MDAHTPFDTATAGCFQAVYLAEVVSVEDPLGLARVQIRLLNWDGPIDQDGPIWARVAVPFAGADRGAFFIPDVGDEVLVAFIHGDPRLPVVCGGLWNGSAGPPESLSGSRVDRWTLVGKAGTRIAIVEEDNPTIEFTTPGGVRGTVTDAGGGTVVIVAAGTTITIDPSGVTIDTGGKLTVSATSVEVTAGMVNVTAGMSQFSGVVQCDTLITNSVISPSYTPGAGNVW